jgi:aspartyl-tRNA(Asn)/glutamyl-tRNA(Gln) amidotransferase subunit C
MSIDTNVVRKVAKLANIKLDEARIAPLASELNAIVGWIEQLAEVDTDGVEPMTSAVAVTLPMREDEVTEGGDAAMILSNAPASRNGFFVVPKVVE